MNPRRPRSVAVIPKHTGYIGIQAGLFLILLALVAHIGYLVGQSYGFQPIVFTGLSIIFMLPPLAYLAMAAHYNNAIFFAVVIYGVVHLIVLPGTPYMLTVAKSLWWIGAGLALAGYGVLAYRFLFKNDGTKTPPRSD